MVKLNSKCCIWISVLGPTLVKMVALREALPPSLFSLCASSWILGFVSW